MQKCKNAKTESRKRKMQNRDNTVYKTRHLRNHKQSLYLKPLHILLIL